MNGRKLIEWWVLLKTSETVDRKDEDVKTSMGTFKNRPRPQSDRPKFRIKMVNRPTSGTSLT